MASELITEIASEKDPAKRAEEEEHAKHASAIAYAGMIPVLLRVYRDCSNFFMSFQGARIR